MADIKLFEISDGAVHELTASTIEIEKSLQTQLEKHLETFLGVRFLESEYRTGKTHAGRIDTLGIDEDNCPVIIEYKRAQDSNVITQGLYYLDWLMDHQAEFELLTAKKLGEQSVDKIEWSSPRLLCIAADFTKFDEHAVQQIPRNISLLRYRRYGQNLLLLELVNASTEAAGGSRASNEGASVPKLKPAYKGFSELLPRCSIPLQELWNSLNAFLMGLGDDVQSRQLKYYVAFRRLKNFACAEIHPQSGEILIYLKLDPTAITLEDGFTRDVSAVGHYGTGDLEIRIRKGADLERAKPLLLTSYVNG